MRPSSPAALFSSPCRIGQLSSAISLASLEQAGSACGSMTSQQQKQQQQENWPRRRQVDNVFAAAAPCSLHPAPRALLTSQSATTTTRADADADSDSDADATADAAVADVVYKYGEAKEISNSRRS